MLMRFIAEITDINGNKELVETSHQSAKKILNKNYQNYTSCEVFKSRDYLDFVNGKIKKIVAVSAHYV